MFRKTPARRGVPVERVFDVIDSCEDLPHLEGAGAYLKLWLRQYAGWNIGWMGLVLFRYLADKRKLLLLRGEP